MKKLTFTLLAFVVLTNGAIAAEVPKPVRVSLELMKNGTPVSKVELAAVEGRKTPYRSVSTQNYVGSCESDGEGNKVLKPSSLTTGITADVTPIRVTPDSALLAVDFSYSELTGMKNARVNGCSVELPEAHNFGNSVSVSVKPGQAVELPSYAGNDKYVLVIRTL